MEDVNYAKSIIDYNGNWQEYIRHEFLRPALKYGVRYEEFWDLTPLSLSDILNAYFEKRQDDMRLQDMYNWQLGQYVRMAVGDCLSGKHTSIYPKEPMFSKKPNTSEQKLSKKQEELETLKFKEFFTNWQGHFAIQKKTK